MVLVSDVPLEAPDIDELIATSGTSIAMGTPVF